MSFISFVRFSVAAALFFSIGLTAVQSAYAQGAGSVLISEFRPRGPGSGNGNSGNNEFIELYNNTNSAINIGGWAIYTVAPCTPAPCTPTRTLRNTFAANTLIPARGHYLITGNDNQYTLSGYPGGGTDATPSPTTRDDNLDMPGINDIDGIGLFTSATTVDATTRVDSVGFALSATQQSDPLFVEGTAHPAKFSSADFTNTSEYSLARLLNSGLPQDTQNNAADFVLVSTDPTQPLAGVQATLGAPGPENTVSPIQSNARVRGFLIDPTVASSQSPNRSRSLTPVTNGTLGTMTIRRKFTNTTTQTVTRLRFRVVDITTRTGSTPPPVGIAELRVLNSLSDDLSLVPGTTIKGTSVETSPAQSLGGGLNPSLKLTDSVTLGTPLAPGASVNVEFRLGVIQGGTFRFFVNVEALFI